MANSTSRKAIGFRALALCTLLACIYQFPVFGQDSVVGFTTASETVSEDAGVVTVSFDIAPAPTQEITVVFFSSGSTADIDFDFTANLNHLSRGRVVVPIGATSASYPITILDDDVDETDETIRLVLLDLSGGNGWVPDPPNADFTLTIQDNDELQNYVNLAPFPGPEVDEGQSATIFADITSPLNYRADIPLIVDSGTSADPQDYGAVSSIKIPAGSTRGSLTVRTFQDDDDEHEILVLRINESTLLGELTIGDFREVTIFIKDTGTTTDPPPPPPPPPPPVDPPPVDPPPVDTEPTGLRASFSTSAQRVNENTGTHRAIVELSEAPSSPVTVSYSVSGIASAGSDYTIANTGSLVFATGQTSGEIPVSIINDSTQESDETVILSLVATSDYSLGSPSTFTLTIVDDDTPPNRDPVVQVSCNPCHADIGGELSFVAEATDADDDALTYSWSATAGTFPDGTNTRSVRWVAGDEPGPVSITVEVSDGRDGSAIEQFTVHVGNRPPAFAASSYEFELSENESGETVAVILGQVTADDLDEDELTYTLVTGDAQRFALAADNGKLSYIGRGEDFESLVTSYELAISVTDGIADAVETTVHVTVTNKNERPQATDDVGSVNEDAEVTIDVLANDSDPDGEAITVLGVTNVENGVVNVNEDGTLTFSPNENFHGIEFFSYDVTDAGGLTATAIVTITVVSVNDAPAFEFSTIKFLLPENVAGSENPVVLGRAIALDPDNDALTYSIVGGEFDRFELSPTDGSIRYIGTGEDFEQIHDPYEFQINSQDEAGATATATILVEVVDVNESPTVTAHCEPCSAPRETEIRLTAITEDPDGDNLTFNWEADSGRFVGAANTASVQWLSSASLGSATVTVTVSDPLGLSNSVTLTLEIVNQSPTFEQSKVVLSLPENQDGTLTPLEIGRVSAQDPDGDALVYELVTGSVDLFKVDEMDGTIHYVGTGEDFESSKTMYSLVLRVSDGFGGTAQTSIGVEIADVNEQPVVTAMCNPCEVVRGQLVSLTTTAFDPDGDTLSYSWTATSGSFTGSNGAPTATWRASSLLGSHIIRVVVMDGRSGRATAELTVQVINRSPVFDMPAQSFSLLENADGSERPVRLGTVIAVDPDGDSLTYSLESGDMQRFTISSNGRLYYIGSGEDFESGPMQYHLKAQAADRFDGVAIADIVVEVIDVNEHPIAMPDDVQTNEDTTVVIDVLANDRDPDGGTLSIHSVTPAVNGTAQILSTGNLSYVPAANFHGVDQFTYTVVDSGGLASTATVDVTVLSINDSPVPVDAIPNQAFAEGGGSIDIDLNPFFADVDGDALIYAAASANIEVVDAVVNQAILTLTPVNYGSSVVTVTATDSSAAIATQTINVEVSDDPQRATIKHVLAATAHGQLASLRSTLNRRLSSDPCASALSAQPHQQMDIDPIDALALTDIGHGSQQSMSSFYGDLGARQGSSLFQSGFVIPVSAVDCGETDNLPRVAIWGHADRQSYSDAGVLDSDVLTSSYDGALTNGYVGVDLRLGVQWLVGLAVSSNQSESDWQAGMSSGTVDQTMTSINPYLHWSNGATTMWAAAGIGSGEIENTRQSGWVGESDSDLRLGLLAMRSRITGESSYDIGFVGDASFAQISTDAGSETIDGQDVGVDQLRLGADIRFPSLSLGGLSIQPAVEGLARRDGGDGLTGNGIEISGSMQIASELLSINIEGRTLATYSETDYQESGVAITLALGGISDGMALTFTPRWGYMSNSGSLLHGSLARSQEFGAERDAWRYETEARYRTVINGGHGLEFRATVFPNSSGARLSFRFEPRGM